MSLGSARLDSLPAWGEGAYNGHMSGKRIVIVAGAVVMMVLGALTMRWPHVIAFYHLNRLRQDPAYFGTILGKPEGSSERIAIRHYLDTKEGKLALMMECIPPSDSKHNAFIKATKLISVSVHVDAGGIWLYDASRTYQDLFGAQSDFYQPPTHAEWLYLTQEYLTRNESFKHPAYPMNSFGYVVTAEEAPTTNLQESPPSSQAGLGITGAK